MAEVAGFVLAVLPLLISAAEHYEDCWRPLVRYRKFTSKLDEFQRKLRTQKTIFRNECLILLELVLERDIATRMLKDKTHVNWNSQIIDKQISEQLASSQDACLDIIAQIREQLQIVEKENRAFDEVIQESGHPEFIGDKKWRNRIAKKLKFSFSESHLNEALAELKSLNDDLIRLSTQISRLEGPERQAEKSRKGLNKSVEKFRLIQEASKHVYGALSNSCTKHTEHLTHFCLEALALENTSTPQVRFKLAFTHMTLSGSATPGDPVWFLVESIIGDSTKRKDNPIQSDAQTFSLVETLKRQHDEAPELCVRKTKKSVRFQATVPSTTSIPPAYVNIPPINLRNLCMRKNFCDQLRTCVLQSPHTDKCLGVLDEIDCYKHLVYFPPSTHQRSYSHATSLEQVISSLSKQGPLVRISQYERLHLARSLATAVLQYHATPWLKGSLRSEEIYFFGIGEESLTPQPCALTAPHLNVRVKGPDGSLSRTATFPPPSCVRNTILFGLGVVLLELGYAKTLPDLQQPRDIQDNENRLTEFFVATRAVSSIGREMGSAYGEIVKKCLYCDFGCGDDLSDPNLQAVFYQDVVQELEKLEEGFRKLQIGP